MTKLASAQRFEEARVERDWIVEQSEAAPLSSELTGVVAAAQVQFYLDARDAGQVPSTADERAAVAGAAILLPGCREGLDDAVITSLREMLGKARRRLH
jgi:hypothetical protein